MVKVCWGDGFPSHDGQCLATQTLLIKSHHICAGFLITFLLNLFKYEILYFCSSILGAFRERLLK